MTTSRPRVAIYARYSSDLQSASSIEDQVRLCRVYAQSRGWDIAGTYEDRATSGATMMRKDVQRLQRDASAGRFDIVLAEALDRLSRNLADIAHLYQSLAFAGIRIETVSEGKVDEMHIGLKGTMNALFLKDLAAKTHRGLEGRVRAGKSAGGRCYGYDILRSLREDGELNRGDLAINTEQAAVVRRIFQAYVDGMSPNRIAAMLNDEGIPGPGLRGWDKSTIYGNPEIGVGILNNALYVGRRVWNRQRFLKDPVTGKRQARTNPPEQWVVEEVPQLRIVPQELWDTARARQEARKIKNTKAKAWERRRPKFLLSGLTVCGCCGGGYSMMSKDRLGCSASRTKGLSVCSNRITIARKDIEARILSALADHLMDPALVQAFAEEYVAERNRLAATRTDEREVRQRELTKVIRDQNVLVDALLAGTPADRIKDRMQQLETRQKQLEAELAAAPTSASNLRIHPRMADTYHTRIRALIERLTEPASDSEARDEIRSLIDRIVVTPVPTSGKRKKPELHLYGDLAGILSMSLGMTAASTGKKTTGDQEVTESMVFLLAGRRSRRGNLDGVEHEGRGCFAFRLAMTEQPGACSPRDPGRALAQRRGARGGIMLDSRPSRA